MPCRKPRSYGRRSENCRPTPSSQYLSNCPNWRQRLCDGKTTKFLFIIADLDWFFLIADATVGVGSHFSLPLEQQLDDRRLCCPGQRDSPAGHPFQPLRYGDLPAVSCRANYLTIALPARLAPASTYAPASLIPLANVSSDSIPVVISTQLLYIRSCVWQKNSTLRH